MLLLLITTSLAAGGNGAMAARDDARRPAGALFTGESVPSMQITPPAARAYSTTYRAHRHSRRKAA